MAETTTTTDCRAAAAWTIAAARRMQSASPTEVPPNFMTWRADFISFCRLVFIFAQELRLAGCEDWVRCVMFNRLLFGKGQARSSALACTEQAPPLTREKWPRLDLLDFPAAAAEQDYAGGGNDRFGDHNGDENAIGVQAGGDRQSVGQRNLDEPESEQIHDGWGDGVAGAVEGLQHDHAVGVADVAVADDAQAGRGQRNDLGVVGEQTHDRLGKDHEEDADAAEKEHVVEAGAPYRFFGALGLLGAEVLADQGGCGVAESPRRQEDEDDE